MSAADASTSSLPFRALVEAAPDGMIVCDAAGAIVLANTEAERMFGYAAGELAGQPVAVLIPEGLRAGHAAHVGAYTAAPRVRPMGIGLELVGRHKSGAEVPIEISLAPIHSAEGTLVTAGIRDVSERRRLERANRRANAYLVSAVDAVHDAFALFDEHDRVMLANSAALHLLGIAEAGDVVGMPFSEVLDRALRAGVFDLSNETGDALAARWLAYHRAPAGVLEVRTGTGRYLRVSEKRTPEQGTVMTIADATDDELRADELDHARARAELASEAKSEFLSSMTHELRTPLNAILGFAQLLERDRKHPLDERQLERIGYVRRGGEHLLKLIDEILDLARIEQGRVVVSVEALDPLAVIENCRSTLAPLAARAGVELAIAPPADPELRLLADATRLAQILMNFGSNAIKYNRPGGHCTFAIVARPGHVRITVTDDGIGIPTAQQAKVFEPFQRAGQEAGPIEGTGIGLAITKRLAELMNGTVGFTSVPDRGSEFWVELPMRAVAVTTRRKVIYVEDNPSNIALMRDVIADLPEVELITAPDAELGLDLVRVYHPDLVIMDVHLPGMSGIEAVRRLRADPMTARIPVLGLSAAALLRDADRARAAGFSRYLTKPVRVGELATTLEELLAN